MNIESESQLRHAYAKLLKPSYFGLNRDALFDLLCDLDWIEKPVVRICHADTPLTANTEDAKTYFKLLADAIERWREYDAKRLEVWFPTDQSLAF